MKLLTKQKRGQNTRTISTYRGTKKCWGGVQTVELHNHKLFIYVNFHNSIGFSWFENASSKWQNGELTVDLIITFIVIIVISYLPFVVLLLLIFYQACLQAYLDDVVDAQGGMTFNIDIPAFTGDAAGNSVQFY